MAASMWSALEQAQAGGGITTGGLVGSVGGTIASGGGGLGDPLWLNSLSSALNVGDAEFWEESISPSTIRTSLSTADPSNPSHTSTLLRGMKWLLANISKGRDVSDFYPHVVKLVQAASLEVRKMVYLYLVQYADYSPTTRELSLLSINSFQRGLGDPEQWIRGLALRVLTSIRLPDIVQIQILAAQKSAGDTSPYVRKCAANAMVKLYRATQGNSSSRKQQQEIIVELLVDLLQKEDCTMVLTSALIAFSELSLELHYLHPIFRKICHLLTDMDEWGQVVVIDLLARYCRTFFRQPPLGAAEKIDRERRVITSGLGGTAGTATGVVELTAPPKQSPSNSSLPKKVKRRVVRKGFYSDEEDTSTEEEVYETPMGQALPSISQALRENPVTSHPTSTASSTSLAVSELDGLAPDHRLLLISAMPLLKSRNAGVVLAVCALAYYCGVASIPTRVAVGKALVRISRDKREIQYVVLTSIRTLAAECPSAFTPYLSDFFITAMDPEFTKLIKLDILTLLALEPAAIERVLNEFRTYAIMCSSSEQSFATAAIRSVGRVAEMARCVHDRHGRKHKTMAKDRDQADTVALNCLYGLVTLSQLTTDKPAIVGECVVVSQRILQMLNSDDDSDAAISPGSTRHPVQDPNQVQARALKRILLLVVSALSSRGESALSAQPQEGEDDEDEDEDDSGIKSRLAQLTAKRLPPAAVASGLWILGEFLASPAFAPSPVSVLGSGVPAIRTELIRLVARCFPELEASEKEQGIHLASKLLLSLATPGTGNDIEAAICEHILVMGRLDVNPDVRDRTRFESGLLHLSVGLRHDLDALDSPPVDALKLTVDQARRILLLRRKPASCSLPSAGDGGGRIGDAETFRFGTLSSLVGHRARSAYVPLPPWAEKDSPGSLRDPPPERKIETTAKTQVSSASKGGGSFYDSSSGSSDDSSSSSSTPSTTAKDTVESADEDSSSDDDDSSLNSETSSKESGGRVGGVSSNLQQIRPQPTGQATGSASKQEPVFGKDNVSSDSGSSSSEDDNDSSSSNDNKRPNATDANLISLTGGGVVGGGRGAANLAAQHGPIVGSVSSSISEDLKGLVLAPVVVAEGEPTDANVERDSSLWLQLVRPDLAGGLSVQARYLRGATKRREAQLMGLVATTDKPNVVCLQMRFENQKKEGAGGGGSFRRLVLQQRSSVSSSSVIGPLKIVTPPEIAQLSPGQRVDCVLGIEFTGISDRDGSLQAKLDVKFGSGSIPIEIKPNLGDLLLPPPNKVSVDSFDAAVGRLHGFQRVESKFTMTTGAAELANQVVRHVAFSPVGKLTRKDDDDIKVRLVGTLPAAGDPVYVLLNCSAATGGQGKVVVCCDHPLAVNSVMNQVKRALA